MSVRVCLSVWLILHVHTCHRVSYTDIPIGLFNRYETACTGSYNYAITCLPNMTLKFFEINSYHVFIFTFFIVAQTI